MVAALDDGSARLTAGSPKTDEGRGVNRLKAG